MAFLARMNIGKRILIIGAASLLGLVLVLALSIGRMDAALTESFNARTQQTLDVAYSQFERFEAEEKAGRMTREQAQAAAKDAIRSMRFGKDDYFFILDTDHNMVLHPVKPEKVGKNVADDTDADGKHHYREMIERVKTDGAGFVSYNYKMPDGSGAKPKISYVRGFKPWGWVIATGVFNEEIRAAVNDATLKLGVVVLFVLLGLAALILVISRSITAPLSQITVRMRTLADGDTRAAIPGADRRDEIGKMAGALQVFRDNAIAKAEAEAAKAQADADQQAIVSLLSEKLEALSEGDLTGTISSNVPATYAALSGNFNTALGNLRDLIAALADASQSIESGSSEIAAASDDLARRTESNAASLEETSAALSQMNARLKSSTEVADRTVDRAQQAIGIVGTGRATAEEATAAMDRVSGSAQGIDDVIEGLDKIAFQTRVLAMNAAVEAGRAGEAGRGFAVVADLVSALAMRAEEEAKRAREQLSTTQSEIRSAVDAVLKVDAALAEITGSVEQVHQFVESMANDNRAQASTISEIATAVNVMDQSTQQNAAMVEQTSAAARNLAGEVTALTEQSARFNVGATKAVRRPAVKASQGPQRATPSFAASNRAEPEWASF
ncbi:cache domain-containing protein [Sphingomonas psychrotolerans]|uniref:Cache domain-containing protein n=1 Tax=Sphingomonas psychrotolerans TaxID=1327635 RepID=A0ABU3N6G1_9SPHN|nr:cache domain-containing protein [Sphingomonas psychrotolerans]MDT8760123.1 cache domain-containing protein [Sphingomonas psychrotolerans]